MDDLLCVVKKEGAEEDEASVHGHAVEASSHGRGGREEGGAEAGAEHNAEAHGQGPAHVEELVTGGAHGHCGEAAHHAGSVPGGPGQDGAPEHAQGGDHSANNSAVGEPGQLLSAQCPRGVGDGARHHGTSDHGRNGDPHGHEATSGHQVHHGRGAEYGSGRSSGGKKASTKVPEETF